MDVLEELNPSDVMVILLFLLPCSMSIVFLLSPSNIISFRFLPS